MSGKIFINYRKAEDSGATAGRVRDHLARAFGRDQLFIDVDDIPVGIDFKAHLNSQLAECSVILVVIGSKWLRVMQRRLDQPEDYVAMEIAAALERNTPVIPVLVDGASIPNESELPNNLKRLAHRQGVDVRNSSFVRDVDALIARMRETVPALLARLEPPQSNKAPSFIVKLADTLNSYLSAEENKGCAWVLALLVALGIGIFLFIFD